ncbi:hypothetical protein DPMN_107518 [Dreissena polymorpha]|uniref:Uncharacterized protein n=1 Tax=Dreissena polymorpha TaxID=45954 RepID=A0A9D4K768_DREPO|nr:hypothetical protein DPMN_107518 [Dreissena polymorpha]
MATAAMARLSRLWTSSSINSPTKYRLYKSHVASRLLDMNASRGHRTHDTGI